MRQKFKDFLKDNPQPPQWNHAHINLEFWRLFIDGNQQLDAESIKSLIKEKFAINLDQYAKLSLKDFLQQPPGSGLNDLFEDYFSSRISQQLIDAGITIEEVFQRVNAWESFERKEKNYLLSLCKAQEILNDHTGPINEMLIKRAHKTCMSHIKFLYDQDAYTCGEYRNNGGTFPLKLKYNTSEKGLDEWLDVMENTGIVFSFYIKHRERSIPCSAVYDAKERKFVQGNGEKISREKLKEIFMDLLQNEITVRTDGRQMQMQYLSRGKFDSSTMQWLNLFIQSIPAYYEALETCNKSASTPDDILYDKLLETIKFIKSSLMYHPFFDGNLRVFVMLILPKLLGDLGLGNIYFFEDPNRFAMYGNEELVDEIIKARTRAHQLMEGKSCSLMELSSTRQAYLALSPKQKDYFRACCTAFPFASHTPLQERSFFSTSNHNHTLLQMLDALDNNVAENDSVLGHCIL